MAKGLREREVKEGRDADKCRILCCAHPDASISCLSCLVMRGIHFFLLRLLPTAAAGPELRFLLTSLLLAPVPHAAAFESAARGSDDRLTLVALGRAVVRRAVAAPVSAQVHSSQSHTASPVARPFLSARGSHFSDGCRSSSSISSSTFCVSPAHIAPRCRLFFDRSEKILSVLSLSR